MEFLAYDELLRRLVHPSAGQLKLSAWNSLFSSNCGVCYSLAEWLLPPISYGEIDNINRHPHVVSPASPMSRIAISIHLHSDFTCQQVLHEGFLEGLDLAEFSKFNFNSAVQGVQYLDRSLLFRDRWT